MMFPSLFSFPTNTGYPAGKTLRFLFFSPSLQLFKNIHSSKHKIMSEIENVGRKGYCLMWFFIFLLLFVILVVAIYKYNFQFI